MTSFCLEVEYLSRVFGSLRSRLFVVWILEFMVYSKLEGKGSERDEANINAVSCHFRTVQVTILRHAFCMNPMSRIQYQVYY